MEPYQYIKLNPLLREIRLFTLNSGTSESKVEGILETYPLEKCPSYQTISYFWGDPKNTKTVLVDGRYLSVTTNIYDVLQHIRDIKHSNTFWIDAISINQNDKNECSQQVQLMKAIFANAASTVAWIGPSSGQSDIGMQFISQFADPNVSKKELVQRAENGECLLRNAVHDLFLRPYWGRVWIVQELASAQTALVRCGQYSAPLDGFQNFVEAISCNFRTIANYMSVTKACRLLKLVKLYRTLSISKQRLIDILWSTVEFQATDQRDKIYAILGIAREQDQDALLPDYTAATTLESLLRDLVRYHLESERDLDIFCYFPPLHPQTP